ncbi:hypothetical protein KHQ89_00050 [Mycoplasmatota bacterium]|nr:hypothetical protein KHQ89_00050 [Mycoplasmatota bacterium]
MKKLIFVLALLLTVSLSACDDTAGQDDDNFDETSSITVYTRDTSSGTRAGFMGKIGFDEAEADDSVLVDGFVIAGNSEIIAAVQEDEFAIGYVSLSTLDTSLFNGLNFDTVSPTEEKCFIRRI